MSFAICIYVCRHIQPAHTQVHIHSLTTDKYILRHLRYNRKHTLTPTHPYTHTHSTAHIHTLPSLPPSLSPYLPTFIPPSSLSLPLPFPPFCPFPSTGDKSGWYACSYTETVRKCRGGSIFL